MRTALARSILIAIAAGSGQARAQQPATADSGYTQTDTLIVARDGTRLFTLIVTPRNATGPLPILMDRTPYGAKNYAGFLATSANRLGLDGYILVVQDIRGRFGSQGT